MCIRDSFKAIPNLTFLTEEEGETARIEELGVAVWGKGMVDHSPNFSPIGGRPSRPDDCEFYLGRARHSRPTRRTIAPVLADPYE